MNNNFNNFSLIFLSFPCYFPHMFICKGSHCVVSSGLDWYLALSVAAMKSDMFVFTWLGDTYLQTSFVKLTKRIEFWILAETYRNNCFQEPLDASWPPGVPHASQNTVWGLALVSSYLSNTQFDLVEFAQLFGLQRRWWAWFVCLKPQTKCPKRNLSHASSQTKVTKLKPN